MKRILFLFIFLVFINPRSNAQTDSLATTKRGDAMHAKVDDSNTGNRKFKDNLKSKYSAAEFEYEPKTREKNFLERLQEWFYKMISKIFGVSAKASETLLSIVKWIVILLGTILAVYMIAKAILKKEGRWIFGSSPQKIIDSVEIEKNLKNTDFETLIASTIQLGDKRLAVRYYYLWLLKKLSERNIIDWNPEKTNSDYLYEIKSDQLKNDFKYVSYLYEYVWYGEFDPDDVVFATAQNRFEKIVKSIP